jgi:acetyl esterase
MTHAAVGTEVKVVDRDIDGPYGPIGLRTYTPSSVGPRTAGFVWCHGGAFAFGDLDMPEGDWVSRMIAQRGIPVVSVDYRLAPIPALPPREGAEPPKPARQGAHRFPVASEEVAAAFEWAANAPEFDVPAHRWSLGGASAGGNLSAGAALRLRDDGRPMPRSLVLAYPLLHAELPPRRPELEEKVAALPGGSFPPEVITAINLNYVGDPEMLTSRYAFPGTHDLHGLPPTFIFNSDHDSLRSSGELFASELAAAGVDVLQIRENDTEHGHLNQPDHPGATRSIERILAWLTVDALVGTAHELSS